MAWLLNEQSQHNLLNGIGRFVSAFGGSDTYRIVSANTPKKLKKFMIDTKRQKIVMMTLKKKILILSCPKMVVRFASNDNAFFPKNNSNKKL